MNEYFTKKFGTIEELKYKISEYFLVPIDQCNAKSEFEKQPTLFGFCNHLGITTTKMKIAIEEDEEISDIFEIPLQKMVEFLAMQVLFGKNSAGAIALMDILHGMRTKQQQQEINITIKNDQVEQLLLDIEKKERGVLLPEKVTQENDEDDIF